MSTSAAEWVTSRSKAAKRFGPQPIRRICFQRMLDEVDPLSILGTTLEEKYRIDSLAGIGGFSAVYRAQHMVWNKPVAIKFFTMLETAKPELRERLLHDFIQEGKLMSQLSSRSAAIVQARDMGKLPVDDDGAWIPYMVLEWLDGTPLDEALSSERRASLPPRTWAEAMHLLEPAAIALDVAHRGNVAHRDLKPANLIITGDPRDPEAGMKVLDFGIAKVMEEQAELQEQLQLTGAHITSFTPNYGAPEQFSRNYGATGPWTDVFAMALILVEVVRGSRVLDAETFFELGVISCDGDARPTPRALGLEVSDEVEATFAKALAVDPQKRFANMGAFWRELHSRVFVGADTWTPRTDKPIMRGPVPAGSTAPMPTANRPHMGSANTVSALTVTGSPGTTRKPLLWVAALMALGSLAVLVLVVTSRETPTAAGDTPATGIGAAASGPESGSAQPGSTVSSGVGSGTPEAAPDPADVPSAAPSASDSSAPAPKTTPNEPEPQTKVGPRPTPGPAGSDTKSPKPAPQPGGDPWDPSSFGGRR